MKVKFLSKSHKLLTIRMLQIGILKQLAEEKKKLKTTHENLGSFKSILPQGNSNRFLDKPLSERCQGHIEEILSLLCH